MARVKNNYVTKGFSGKLGNDLIFKTYRFGTVASKYPDMSKVKLSARQKKTNRNFAEAVGYARSVIADTSLKKAYEKKAKKSGRTIYHLALSDFLRGNVKH